MLPLLLLRQRVAMILKMYRRRFHFPCPLRAAMAGGRVAGSLELATFQPAFGSSMRPFRSPFQRHHLSLAIPTVAVAGMRRPTPARTPARCSGTRTFSTPSGVLSLRPTALRISGAPKGSNTQLHFVRPLIDHRNHLNFDQLFGLS